MICMEDDREMPVSDYQLAELKHAYQILGVPLDASAHSIKQTYRRLVKRWHPDLYEDCTPSHAEATDMTRMINEAYSAIAHAPLRYHVETYPHQAKGRSGQTTSPTTNEPTSISADHLPKSDRLEFWVRFVCGALFGIFVCLRLVTWSMPDSLQYSVVLALGSLGVILGFGFAAARYGDKFWYTILRHWWLWP